MSSRQLDPFSQTLLIEGLRQLPQRCGLRLD